MSATDLSWFSSDTAHFCVQTDRERERERETERQRDRERDRDRDRDRERQRETERQRERKHICNTCHCHFLEHNSTCFTTCLTNENKLRNIYILVIRNYSSLLMI